MFMIGKCVFTFCIISMMSPKLRPALAVRKLQQDYYHARRGRSPITSFSNLTNKYSSIGTHRKPHQDSRIEKYTMKGFIVEEVRSDDVAGGFDLTDEEIIKFKIWPEGVIPYYIDVLSFKDKVLRDRIRGFLNVVNGLTGLNFLELLVPPQDEKNRWVLFINRRGLLDCADHSIKNFTNKGVQHVILGYDCMSTRGELAEAVLAIAGLPPQHNAPNRDKYIKVAEDNIMPEKRYLFEKLNDNEWLFHDIAYDFYSAGHYHSHKYSVNGQATIEIKKKNVEYGEVGVVQSGNKLSNSDIRKIKMLYSYISKKKQAHIPECHKLFQPGKNFNSYLPRISNIKAQKKPNKYLDIADDEKNVDDDDEKDTGDEEGDVVEDDTKDTDDEPDDVSEDDTKDASDEAYDVTQDDEKDTGEDKNSNNDSKNSGSDDDQNSTKENNKNDDNDNLSHEDKETGRNLVKEDFKKLIYYYDKDPVNYLSDYRTGDERPQKFKYKKIAKGDDNRETATVINESKNKKREPAIRFVKPGEIRTPKNFYKTAR